MPQASRKDTLTQKIQDKEAKRARGALSCAECRRLKLKCDKTVPCSSCKRRGCAAICPNGSLITGEGTRFVLADTGKLHQKITQMSDRIRLLEDALEISQKALTGPNGEPHPLLDRDLMKIKSSIELHSASTAGGSTEETVNGDINEEDDDENYIDTFGTLAIRDGGAATFYGRSAGQESLLIGEVSAVDSPTDSPVPSYGISATSSYTDVDSEAGPSSQVYPQRQLYGVTPDAPLSENLVNLTRVFPLAPSLPPTTILSPNPSEPITLSILITRYLPPYNEAIRLVQLYLEQAPWFFGAVTEKQIEQEIMPMWYEAELTADSNNNPSTLPGTTVSKQRTGTSHDLALLFMVFCFGSLTDMNLPAPPDNAPADKFYQLTKVALTLDPNASADAKSTKNGILDRPPSVATVQTFSLMAIYEGLCSGENSIEATWTLFGLATKLSQSIGLHRDAARWKLPPAEVQKRRALFWELFITDCWQSLATGRLATFSLPFVDCELPYDPDQTIAEDGSIQPSFPFWKARFGAECVSAVVQGTLTSRAPKYSIILDLDRKVRDMELPLYAHGPPPDGKGLRQTMSHFMPQNYRELTLIYIHRCFFAHAISSNSVDPIKSQYAPSFLAGYRSACTILNAVKQQFTMFPAQIARFWVLWTHAFSASVMLASVATHASRSKIAPAALLELKIACDLFEAASKYGGRAGKFLPILRRLQMKGQKAYRDSNNGVPSVPNDIFRPSKSEEEKDEFSIFSGKTHTVNTVTVATPVAPPVRPAASSSSSTQNESSPQAYTDNPYFAGVHPSLINELNSFQPLIREQVQNAYRIGGDVFGGGPMTIDPIRRVPAGQITGPQPPQPPALVPVGLEQSMQSQFHQHWEQQQNTVRQQELDRERLERERLERERQESERRELERQELERQEIARQQQLEFERQQVARQEIQRQQENRLRELQRQQEAQEEALRRQQQEKAQQLQRQEQYRQQLEIQQRQLEQQHQQQQRQMVDVPMRAPEHPGVETLPAGAKAKVPPLPPVQPQISHSQSSSSLRQRYQQLYQQPSLHDMVQITPQRAGMSAHAMVPQHSDISQQQQQRLQQNIQQQRMSFGAGQVVNPQHTGMSSNTTSITPQHTGGVPQIQQQHHSMYAFPQSEYSQHHQIPIGYTPSPSSYGGDSQASSTIALSASPSFIPETYKYWPAASTSFAMPNDQVPMGMDYTSQTPLQPQPQYHHQQQPYTPDAALRGIAADDRSLQETWQSYMNKVGSPRQFLED